MLLHGPRDREITLANFYGIDRRSRCGWRFFTHARVARSRSRAVGICNHGDLRSVGNVGVVSPRHRNHISLVRAIGSIRGVWPDRTRGSRLGHHQSLGSRASRNGNTVGKMRGPRAAPRSRGDAPRHHRHDTCGACACHDEQVCHSDIARRDGQTQRIDASASNNAGTIGFVAKRDAIGGTCVKLDARSDNVGSAPNSAATQPATSSAHAVGRAIGDKLEQTSWTWDVETTRQHQGRAVESDPGQTTAAAARNRSGRYGMTPSLELGLLLARADERAPVLSQSIVQKDASGMDDPGDERASHAMRDPGADPNDLVKQRYAVLVPEGSRGDRLLDLVRPLLDSRSAEQGGVPVLETRVPSDLTTNTARAFREQILRKNAPRYWLVLGDLHEVSLETTAALASHSFVGRLGFSKDDDYRSYVEKVLRWEDKPSSNSLGQTVLCSVRDGTPATALAYRALMRPLEDACANEQAQDQFQSAGVRHVSASSLSDLRDVFRSGEPTTLFSSSHGVGPPRGGYSSPQEQKRLSGAMSLGQDRLTGDDVRNGPFLAGGIWFYMACYGAGTPARSVFAPWLQWLAKYGAMNQNAATEALAGLPMAGTAPFVAALPQAALANPEGPLAVIGHVDLAWSASYADPSSRENKQTTRFFGALRALVEGRRVGIAHGELARFMAETATDLADMYDEETRGNAPLNDSERDVYKAHLWMRRHDLGHYVLLGDPAVRLPLAKNRVVRAKAAEMANIELMELAVFAVLGRGERAEIVARQMNLNPDEVMKWVSEYQRAGRERLTKFVK